MAARGALPPPPRALSLPKVATRRALPPPPRAPSLPKMAAEGASAASPRSVSPLKMAARKCRRPLRVRAAAPSAATFLARGGGGGGGGGRLGATAARPCQGPCVLWRRPAPSQSLRPGRERHSPPLRAPLAAPAAAPSPGLPPRGENGGRMTELQSALLLRRQLAELNKNPVEGFSAGLIDDNDLYRWEVLIIGPPDTLYEGGVFKAHLTFPKDYPLRPPKMKFITEIWHPNVDKNGDVCISILHEPGEDKYGYEKPEERWLPIHTVETIMISVISMLADPNGDSPANVDAAKEWREDRNGEFKRKVARCVRKSQETAFE
ncbi:ubiquitin-conjugating enzyme E2 G1 [Phaenicophaeus curvirostris]|uniref:ubiquitin-conjugating enzyme E2 G1 n=1 Tax=Phaenicophaeus curvirostris TaxID=33595 RepID=UPI0037F0E41F